MMPARRAVCRGSPFLTAPDRICAMASLDIVIRPRAMASRVVTGLSLTSTIRTSPEVPTCDRRADSRARLAGCIGVLRIEISLREEERQAFERDRQVDA